MNIPSPDESIDVSPDKLKMHFLAPDCDISLSNDRKGSMVGKHHLIDKLRLEYVGVDCCLDTHPRPTPDFVARIRNHGASGHNYCFATFRDLLQGNGRAFERAAVDGPDMFAEPSPTVLESVG